VVEQVRRAPGRPRSETARRAILDATLALAAEQGPKGVRMDAIASRAGVSKETLYRWWRSKAEVLLEALAHRGEQTIPVPDTGSLAGDLPAFLRATARSADPPTQRLLRALAAEAAADAGFADLARETFLARRRADLSEVLDRAVARGELTADQAATAIDLIYGSLWYRIIFGIGPLDERWADGVADLVTALTRTSQSLGHNDAQQHGATA
jgi:AcrR family transcriptional regulator